MPRDNAQIPKISVVVPLYNEQENLVELHLRLSCVLDSLALPSEMILVDDGSDDQTPRLLTALSARDPRVVPVHLTRNFGHQAAVTAGIDHALGDAVIVMDADLQDPPELIPALLERWRDGFEVVYAVRQRRKESFSKRLAYAGFYRLLGMLSDHPIPRDAGDFCLMDRCVVDAMKCMPERVRFVRGLRAYVGFRQVGLPYDRPARAAGDSKYTFSKLLRLALDGLVSFGGQPLRLVTYCGLLAALLALGMTCWVLLDAVWSRTAPKGWASLIVVILFMGSVQLLSLGIVGEYLRLIFLEAKGRPSYVARTKTSPAQRALSVVVRERKAS